MIKIKKILERFSILEKIFKIKIPKLKLGPVLPIRIKNKNKKERNIMIRNFNFNNLKPKNFEKVYLLPLHFKVSDKLFNKLLSIIKNLNC